MAKNAKSLFRGVPSVETATDAKLVKVLEETVEGEVLRNIQRPLASVVHKAVMAAIRKAASATAQEKVLVQRPSPGGRCAAVWDELDRIYIEGHVPTLKQVLELGKEKRWNLNNTRIEYYQWRRSKGILGRAALRSDGKGLERRTGVGKRPRGASERRVVA